MKTTHDANLITKASALAIVALVFCAARTNAQTIIYSDTFSGSGGVLNGVAAQGGTGAGTLWSANSAFLDNGTINGVNEGSALLPFNPVAGGTYTLTLDVFNSTDRWIALGFARDPLASAGASSANDRLSNETEGIAWMLLRNSTTANQDVQIFAGLRTTGTLYSADPVGDFSVGHQLKIVLGTSDDGASIMANFFLDGASLLPGGTSTNLVRNIDDINYVGLAFDNSTTGTVTFGNFMLTVVPEPATGALVLLGFGVVAVARRQKS